MAGAVAEPRAPLDRPSHSGERRPRPELHRRGRQAAALALLVGTLLRLAQYGVNRSLWLDEALLVSNFLDRSWAGLFAPFQRGQTAPLGFLALEKLAAAALGRSEYALRLVPLLAGLATLALLPRVARRYATRPALPLGVALVALAPFLVYYASEVKPYALDALCALAVLALAHDLARRPRDGRLAAGFCAFGTAALWLSQPVAFMLAGTGLVLGARALRRGDGRALALLAGTAAAWAASFAGAYLYARHQLEDPAYMRAFWRVGFFPLPPRSAADWLWLPRMAARAFREPMGIVGSDDSWLSRLGVGAALVLFAAGCAWMWRHRRLRLGLLLAPAGLALCASAARAYPFGGEFLSGGRVLIFLLPSLALVMAEGGAALGRWAPRGAGRAVFAAGAALALLPAGAYAALSVPHLRAEVKPLLAWVNENRRPGDVMYVYYHGQSVFEYYAPRYGWNRGNTVAGVCARFHPERYVGDLARLRGRPRVWVLVVTGAAMRGFQEDRVIVGFLDHVGRRLDDRVAVGARMYLYDLAPPGPPPGPYSFAVPRFPPNVAMDCRGAWQPLNLLR
jgi:hypothetical protein